MLLSKTKVIKRDLSEEKFQIHKILNSMNKAYNQVYRIDTPQWLENLIEKEFENSVHVDDTIDSKDIQRLVEQCMLHYFPGEVTKAYILHGACRHCNKVCNAKTVEYSFLGHIFKYIKRLFG